MGRRIRKGMRVMLKCGPARGLCGTVIDDHDGRTVRWDPTIIMVQEGLESIHHELELTRVIETEEELREL